MKTSEEILLEVMIEHGHTKEEIEEWKNEHEDHDYHWIIEAMERFAKQKHSFDGNAMKKVVGSCRSCKVSEVISQDGHCNCCGSKQKNYATTH